MTESKFMSEPGTTRLIQQIKSMPDQLTIGYNESDGLHVIDGSITSAKLADGSVTDAKLEQTLKNKIERTKVLLWSGSTVSDNISVENVTQYGTLIATFLNIYNHQVEVECNVKNVANGLTWWASSDYISPINGFDAANGYRSTDALGAYFVALDQNTLTPSGFGSTNPRSYVFQRKTNNAKAIEITNCSLIKLEGVQ